ncbi:MAG TPA: hypothetical protein VHN14_25550 [Kofleriaceae bacterium]|jgi:hypothetical protein|nr:hypothetical protein [Kofleriaceae bacterium]
MTRLAMTRLVATLPILASLAAGCSQDDPGTSVQVALAYDDALGLETADVSLIDRSQSGPIAHQLLLLVPDDLAGAEMPMEVWGRKAGKRAAYGTATTTPKLGETVAAAMTLTACAPACQNDMLTTCTGSADACPLGCSEDGDAHCIAPRPSNGVDPTMADPLHGTTTISADTTFDGDTGAISGGLRRDAGTGVARGIGYVQAPAFGTGGSPLAIFAFHDLTIEAAATVRFTGTRAIVLLVGGVARIAGAIDVAAGHDARSAPGPGGGAGGTAGAAAQGCGAGGAGTRDSILGEDSGGAGGGAGTAGGAGGEGGATPGGAAGRMCLPARLEPLQGGSGGGAGSPGLAAITASGGGGGGALQITALGSLEVSGTINAGGAGGDGGPLVSSDAGAGGGGGSGGAILLEAPTVTVGSKAILAANGGGGGGGGTNTVASNPGASASASLSPAPGGSATTLSSADGGDGGAEGVLPAPGGIGANSSNGGGGGGAVGAIVIRGRVRMLAGTTSPSAIETDVQ